METSATVPIRIAPSSLDYTVDVVLRSGGERWIAVATIGHRREVGLGGTPRAALVAALTSLPPADTTVLLADTVLLAASVRIAALQASRSA